ncbi:MAG: hypothetical protein RIT81_44470 [Deltaproteobacteria bacterium]
MSLEVPFSVNLDGGVQARFLGDHLFSRGCVKFGDETVVDFDERRERLIGRWRDHEVRLELPDRDVPDPNRLALYIDDERVPQIGHVRLKPSRSAWIHATQALLASFAGFVASWLYLVKAEEQADAWAMKMGIHTAGWHLLLTLTLFAASVWGQRIGIRAVQFVSLVFFCIHAGMAIANFVDPSPLDGPGIAVFNAISGIFFFVAVVYGNTAARDMTPK